MPAKQNQWLQQWRWRPFGSSGSQSFWFGYFSWSLQNTLGQRCNTRHGEPTQQMITPLSPLTDYIQPPRLVLNEFLQPTCTCVLAWCEYVPNVPLFILHYFLLQVLCMRTNYYRYFDCATSETMVPTTTTTPPHSLPLPLQRNGIRQSPVSPAPSLSPLTMMTTTTGT